MSVKILAYSISPEGIPLITFELEYPRFILAELNTHCMLARNTASSRAIPIETVIELIQSDPVMPAYWGKKNKGMSAVEEIEDIEAAKKVWLDLRDSAIKAAKEFDKLQLHKQIANRILEPWVKAKTVLSGTEMANFFHLRYHKAAQPEFRVLAQEMYEAVKNASPTILQYGEWHLPYVDSYRCEDGNLHYFVNDQEISLQQAQRVSASCCAQVSYRKLDESIDKADKIFSTLIESSPSHASPVEHQATPINPNGNSLEGITHMDRNGMPWSAKFRGWIQLRKLIENESVPGFYIDIPVNS